MNIEDDMRARVGQQGLGGIINPIRCPVCNYLALTMEEHSILISRQGCPNCHQTNVIAQIGMFNYMEVANWLGQYAISENVRDNTSAVIMFCAMAESLLEIFNREYLRLHPERMSRIQSIDKLYFEDVVGMKLSKVLESAPESFRTYSSDLGEMQKMRNKFLHGKATVNHISQADAHRAMDLALTAISVYVWLNNKYCLKS